MNILKLNHIDAREFFLKQESYFSTGLPRYFKFESLLLEISWIINENPEESFYVNPPDYSKQDPKAKHPFPWDFEDVNYKLFSNKDWRFSWRKLELINPFLYVSLAHTITSEKNWNFIINRFKEFSANKKIECHSIPRNSESNKTDKADTIRNWWEKIEQSSLEQWLSFEFCIHTDITDCYWSIYTHSIPWALHEKEEAKKFENRNNPAFIWNLIDKKIQWMSYGQTNWIPQGSRLMDFIAEIVLWYADLKLWNEISRNWITDYKILRYRDDYRIFTNNSQDGEQIMKILTEVLIELWMKLNWSKTKYLNNIIQESIKPGKLHWLINKYWTNSIWDFDVQKNLLVIHDFSLQFQNSWNFINGILEEFYLKINDENLEKSQNRVLIAILIDIAYRNPETYPMITTILSKILSCIDWDKQELYIDKILNKFNKIPNTTYLKLWLQRMSIKHDRFRVYDDNLCHLINWKDIKIWNYDWLSKHISDYINWVKIIDEDEIDSLDEVISKDEVTFFIY